jgi:integrase
MATVRERRPGVWEIRVFTGTDARGRPTQLSKTIHGGKRTAQRVAAEMESGSGRASPGGRTVSDVLDAWVEQNLGTWAPSSARDQQSRVRSLKRDPIARVPLARLSVGDVERWHTRLRQAGMADAGIKNQHSVLRAALTQAVRWGWASTNVASMARQRSTRTQQRSVMSVDEVRAVMATAATIDPAAALALRLAAVAGARRAELAALQWTDQRDRMLTIDSAIEFDTSGDGTREFRDAATKTANVRTVSLDRLGRRDRRVAPRAGAVRAVDVWPRPGSGESRPDRLVVEARPPALGDRLEVATARPPSLVGDGRHRAGS